MVLPRSLTYRVVALVSAATVAIDASATDLGTLVAGGDLTMGRPSSPQFDGQPLSLRIRPNGHTISFHADYRFSDQVPAPAATTGVVYMTLLWDSTDGKWDVVGCDPGTGR